MIDRTAIAEVVTRLYTAAGRRFGEPELVLYAEVLGEAGVDGADAVIASQRMVRQVDFGARPPSPKLLLEFVAEVVRERRSQVAAIPESTGPLASRQYKLDRVQALRRAHRGADPRPVGDFLPPAPAESGQVRPITILGWALLSVAGWALCLVVLWLCVTIGTALAVRG